MSRQYSPRTRSGNPKSEIRKSRSLALIRGCLLFVASLLPGTVFPQAGATNAVEIAAEGAVLEKLADGFSFTEGPTADAAGNVYFTDQPNDRILKWSTAGALSTFQQPCGRANGMFFDRSGRLITCADEHHELRRVSTNGTHEVLASTFEGKPLNGPNDVWIRPDGAMYFTDPFYKRPWWEAPEAPQGTQQVYFLPADRKELRRVTTDLVQPNGIIGTADGKRLFVSDIKAGKTWSYSIQADGSLTNKALFCSLGSDGMTIDAEGRVYLTGKGVIVFDARGEQVSHIAVPEGWTANVCFGGPKRDTLFITASKGLYALRTRTRGQEQGK
jgi:gluconolactonase